jgi:hypothetical protein
VYFLYYIRGLKNYLKFLTIRNKQQEQLQLTYLQASSTNHKDHAVDNIETMRRAIKIGALPEGWKYEFQQNIEQLDYRLD